MYIWWETGKKVRQAREVLDYRLHSRHFLWSAKKKKKNQAEKGNSKKEHSGVDLDAVPEAEDKRNREGEILVSEEGKKEGKKIRKNPKFEKNKKWVQKKQKVSSHTGNRTRAAAVRAPNPNH